MTRSRKRAPKLERTSERLAEPTVQLFDAIWTRALPWLQSCSKQTAKYFQDAYLTKTTPAALQKQFRCSAASPGQTSLRFGGFWSGLVGTYPGSGSGSHSQWQALVSGKVHESPLSIFESMQTIFQKERQDKFRWRTQMHFVAWPELPANSESLRSAGRSPAVDFWQARDQTKLCGSCNHYHMHRRTDDAASMSPEGSDVRPEGSCACGCSHHQRCWPATRYVDVFGGV